MAVPYLFSPYFSRDVDGSRTRDAYDVPSPSGIPDGDDVALLARLRAGDESAFDEIFRVHTPAMHRAAVALLGASDPAADVVQDVMARLWLQRERLAIRGAFGAYLRVATVNAARNVMRGTTRGRAWTERAAVSLAPVTRQGSEENDAFDETLLDRRIAVLEHAMARLPDRTREIFVLWWNGELSYREIAQATGISVKGVERARARALDALRRALIDAGLGPSAER
jgi:RNA polymerase sigma-70 factor (ECF subfamily)